MYYYVHVCKFKDSAHKDGAWRSRPTPVEVDMYLLGTLS
jgi:hypothetical protein